LNDGSGSRVDFEPFSLGYPAFFVVCPRPIRPKRLAWITAK